MAEGDRVVGVRVAHGLDADTATPLVLLQLRTDAGDVGLVSMTEELAGVLVDQVNAAIAKGVEKAWRDRHDALMAAFAVRDEQPALTPTDVRQSRPEDFATPQTGEQHRVDHRPIPIFAQGRDQLDDVVVIEDAWQMPHRAQRRDHPPITRHRRPHRHAPLHRIVIELTKRAQMRIEPTCPRQTASWCPSSCDGRQATSDRRQRQPL